MLDLGKPEAAELHASLARASGVATSAIKQPAHQPARAVDAQPLMALAGSFAASKRDIMAFVISLYN